MSILEGVWQAGANAGAALWRLVPKRSRYPVAVRLARATSRWVGPMLMKRPQRYLFSTLLDETLRAILRVMARHGIAFDPRPRLCAPADLYDAVGRRGALFVGAHFPLNAMVTRYLHDCGCRPIALLGALYDGNYIWGTFEPLECITPGPTVLLTLRRQLDKRRAIVMVIDRAAEEERTQLVETAIGPVPIATPIFEFARRTGVPLFWICARTDDEGVPFVHIETMEPSLDSYAALLRQHASALHR